MGFARAVPQETQNAELSLFSFPHLWQYTDNLEDSTNNKDRLLLKRYGLRIEILFDSKDY